MTDPWLSAENVTIEQRLEEMVRRTELEPDTQDVITAILRSPRAVVLTDDSPSDEGEVVAMSYEDLRAEIDQYKSQEAEATSASQNEMRISEDAVVTSMSLDEFR